MAAPKAPTGLAARGRRLWRDLHEVATLDPAQTVLAEEACRIVDRLDKLDELLRGDTDLWVKLTHNLQTESYELKIDGALSESRQQANVLKQLLVTLRLPDASTGKQPQRRGARGAYSSSGAVSAGRVSSLDRARQAKSGT